MSNLDFTDDEDDERPVRRKKRRPRDDDEDDDDRPSRGRGCVECGSTARPSTVKSLSGGGWAMFIVLLLVCFPLCWIPFVVDSFKETKRVCQRCGRSIQVS